ncbi:hypothetical protein UlMin_000383 [Ulmus minor]
MQNASLGGKKYIFVCVDDFSRFTWVGFLKEKSKAFDIFKMLIIKIQVEKNDRVVKLRSDHGKEFENTLFDDFCAANGISHEFSAPITPQHYGVVERKNRVIQEMASVMLLSKDIPKNIWAEAVSTACYIINRPIDLVNDNPDSNTNENSNRTPHIPFKKTNIIKEAILGDANKGIEPKNIKEALIDDFWISAMQDELNQFVRNDVWELVPRPDHANVVGTKWIFRNKSDKQGIVIRNKARLVAQGYSQE